MKLFLASVMGKFSEKTLNSPSFFLLSGLVSSWKKSLKDCNWISRKSGYSNGFLMDAKFILSVVVAKVYKF